MQTKETTHAYEIYVQAQRDKTGKTAQEIQEATPLEKFEIQIFDLYQQWQAGEFSFGRFTELIGVPHWELWEILEALGLPIHH
jgi:predicted HTH domain antitoxin